MVKANLKLTSFSLISICLSLIWCPAFAASSYSRYMDRANDDQLFNCQPVLAKASRLSLMVYSDLIEQGESVFASAGNQAYQIAYKELVLRDLAIARDASKLKTAQMIFSTYEKQTDSAELMSLFDKCVSLYENIRVKYAITGDTEVKAMMAADQLLIQARRSKDPEFNELMKAVPVIEIDEELSGESTDQAPVIDPLAPIKTNDYAFPLGINERIPLPEPLSNVGPEEVEHRDP